MRHKKRNVKRTPSVADVLHGHASPTIEQLFHLIHQVNPTDQPLPEKKRDARYQEKSALQSVLIEQFADQIAIEPCNELGDSTITIRHRFNRRDACHARLDRLTPEARSKARYLLDSEPNDGPLDNEPAPAAQKKASPARVQSDSEIDDVPQLVQRGRHAIEEYDFDAAQAVLTRAVEVARDRSDSEGMIEATIVLFELLVDHLADNQSIRTRYRESPESLASDERVRFLAALAAARVGEVGEAESLVHGIELNSAECPRGDELRLELARSALRSGNLERCEKEVEAIGATSQASPEAQRLADEMRRIRRDRAAALEAELAEKLSKDDARARDLAREIVQLDPDNEAAKAALRSIHTKSEARERERRGAAIEKALASGALTSATRLLQGDAELTRDRPDLVAAVEAANTAHRKRTEETAIVDLVASMGSDLTTHGVAKYWGVDAHVRCEVQARLPDSADAARWLDELGSAQGNAAVRSQVRVATLLAEIGSADPSRLEAMIEELGRHDSIVRRSRRAVAAVDDARQQLAAWRSEQGIRRLSEAATLIQSYGDGTLPVTRTPGDEADLSRAVELLSNITTGDLTATDLARADEFRGRGEHQRQLHEHRNLYEQLLERGDLVSARARVDQILKQVAPESREEWRATRRQLGASIRAVWQLEVTHGRAALRMPEFDCSSMESPSEWLLPDRKGLVLIRALADWLFVRVLYPEDPDRSRAVSMRTPVHMSQPTWRIDGDAIWVVAPSGHILVLAHETFELQQWIDLSGSLDRESQTYGVVGGRFAWAHVGKYSDEIRVIDLHSGQAVRRLPNFSGVHLPGRPNTIVMAPDHSEAIAILDERGATRSQVETPDHQFEQAARDPQRGGMLLLLSRMRPEDDPSEWDRYLVLRYLPDTSSRMTADELEFPDSSAELIHSLGSAKDTGLALVAYNDTSRRAQLATVQAGPDGLQVLWKVETPQLMTIATDPDGQRLVYVSLDGEQVWVRDACSRPPDAGFPNPLRNRDIPLPRLTDSLHCDWLPRRIKDQRETFGRPMQRLPTHDGTRRIFDAARQSEDRDDLCGLMTLVPWDADTKDFDELAQRILEKGDSVHRLVVAGKLLALDRFEEAWSLLEPCTLPDSDNKARQHAAHLSAYCALHLGRAETALQHAEAASTISGSCNDIDDLVAFCKELTGVTTAPGTPLTDLRSRIEQADEALAAAQPRRVVALLDCQLAWIVPSDQVFARLAAAWLDLPNDDSDDLFRKRLAVAAFLWIHRISPTFVLGKGRWSKDRIEQVRRGATAWMDGHRNS